MPSLTVVIPTKDRPPLLLRAIESVLAQEDDVEVIVVDDGSQAENSHRVAEICSTDKRIRLLRNQASQGPSHARNSGLSAAQGRFWATLDDDDEWLPGKWNAQRKVFEACAFPVNLVVVCAVRFTRDGSTGPTAAPQVRAPEGPPSLTALFDRVPLRVFLKSYVAPTGLMRSIGGYDARLIWGEHTDILIRLWRKARFAGSDHVGVFVRRYHEYSHSRLSQNWSGKAEGIKLLMQKHGAILEQEPDLRALYLEILGVSQFRAGLRWSAVSTFGKLAMEGPGFTRRARGIARAGIAAIGGSKTWSPSERP